MTERGYIAVPRAIFSSSAFAAEPYTEREAFLSLVADAAWKPRTVRLRRGSVALKRGQLLGSTRYLSERWQWPESRVRRFLNRIAGRRANDAQNDGESDAQSDALIDAQPTGDGTIITIRNYDSFQRQKAETAIEVDAQPDAQNDAQSDAQTVSETTQREEDNKIITPSEEGETRARASLLPPDFRLDDNTHNWALNLLGTNDAVARSLERFRNHYRQVSGQQAYSRDWTARARNWIDQDARDKPPETLSGTAARLRDEGFTLGPRPTAPLLEEQWDRALAVYAKTGQWTRHVDVMGPDPLSPACRAPRHLMEKHGLKVSAA